MCSCTYQLPLKLSSYCEQEEEKCFFIVSPKDVIVATEPDDDDHVAWLLDNEQFVEALEFCSTRKLARHNYAEIGRDYIRFLIDDWQLKLAAQKCKMFLFSSQEWEREALAFNAKDSLRLLVPYLPIQNPQLRPSIYGEALREFIEAGEFGQSGLEIDGLHCLNRPVTFHIRAPR